MAALIGGYGLFDALKAEGFLLPDDTAYVRLIAEPDSLIILQLDIFMTSERLEKLGRALIRLAEERKT